MLDFSEEFQRRRRKAGVLALPLILAGAALLLVLEVLLKGRPPLELGLVAAFAVLMLGVIVGAWVYRCPGCDRVPNDGDGVPFNPAQCLNCGAKLR